MHALAWRLLFYEGVCRGAQPPPSGTQPV